MKKLPKSEFQEDIFSYGFSKANKTHPTSPTRHIHWCKKYWEFSGWKRKKVAKIEISWERNRSQILTNFNSSPTDSFIHLTNVYWASTTWYTYYLCSTHIWRGCFDGSIALMVQFTCKSQHLIWAPVCVLVQSLGTCPHMGDP